MILVNDNWEEVRDLQDVSKIIRENYNYDLADELDKLIPEHDDNDYFGLECDMADMQNEISALEDENSYLEGRVDELENKVEDLEKEIEKLEEYKAMYEDLCK